MTLDLRLNPRGATGVSPDWAGFSDPADAGAFLEAWFSILLSEIDGVRSAVLMLESTAGTLVPAVQWPDASAAAPLVPLAQRLAQTPDRTLLVRDDGAQRIGFPLFIESHLHGVIALACDPLPPEALQAALRRLHWGSGWVHAIVQRSREMAATDAAERSGIALDMLAAAEDAEGLDGAMRGLVNELRLRLLADRAAVTLLQGRRLRLRAVSETAEADRRMRDMRSLHEAMNEARLQGRPLIWPDPADDGLSVLAAHRAHARRAGVAAMISLPLMLRGKLLGVITLERLQSGDAPGDQATAGAFTRAEVALAQALCASVAPAVHSRMRAHRLLSGRLVEMLGRGWTRLFGPGYPVLKLGAGLAVALALVLALLPWTVTLSAPARVLGEVQRAVVAPFDGYIEAAHLRAGDAVAAGDVIAVLDTRDLALEQSRLQAEAARIDSERLQTLAEGNRVGLAMLDARAASVQAELALVATRLDRAMLRAPLDGIIVSGDLGQSLGAPVSRGDVLFEVAAHESHIVALEVGEHDIDLIARGAEGRVALVGLSGAPLAIRIDHLGAVSDITRGQNAFMAEARFITPPPAALRPGMAGRARIDAGQASLFHALSRNLMLRLRHLLWRLSP
ncbi:HlyD family efflux transporter periplasmic adaptor subunit [Rhodobacteraceae bacterium 2376]|uniref:HlyD family efflux transporter periplasmic adaptor subunit n=1 Tax=Rhabdonatronobacter sediminivivens TaxID=2743469 RepID=A0A7Z0KYJ9_9RHOB|nr:HlyD family efflux transporter periplasmic adaptor subunit [Rhabdonatronobacter sediminivivens]NYS25280.1 HlyD family efflux transporter periplasmic adaptor subunit [Rhabdonatronobacter sediminivivens]